MEAVCTYCGRATTEPLNRFGTHDYCLSENDVEESDDGNRAE